MKVRSAADRASRPRSSRHVAIVLLGMSAIAVSYLDRQTLPWAIKSIGSDFPISNQAKALLDSSFLVTYGLMYLGGGWLLDRIGTRRGLFVSMVFWSLACASHGLAGGVAALAMSRLLLGAGEGAGFPAVTRVVAEWFPPHHRATALGIINAGPAVGAVIAPPLIAAILLHIDWLGFSGWRWVFFLTGAAGLVWAIVWWRVYRTPDASFARQAHDAADVPTLADLLARREVRGIVAAKFLGDAAWYFYLFWLPKYLFEAHGFDLKQAATIGWIPYAASGFGSIAGGWLSSRLLARGFTPNAARKIAMALSVSFMPFVMFAPFAPSVGMVIAIFSLAFFGQQSWATLVMTVPTDLVPHAALGKLAGLVGMGGALGGVLMGQAAGWLLDHGVGYTPVLAFAATLHVIGFLTVCVMIPRIAPIDFPRKARS